MQQMQYNAPNRMYVFQNFRVSHPKNPFGAVTQNRAPSPPKSRLRDWWKLGTFKHFLGQNNRNSNNNVNVYGVPYNVKHCPVVLNKKSDKLKKKVHSKKKLIQSNASVMFSKSKFSLKQMCIFMTVSWIHIGVLKAVCDIPIGNNYNISLLKYALFWSRNYVICIKIHFHVIFACTTQVHHFLLVEFILKTCLGISFCTKFYRKT